jgi:hypothetical protein
MKNPLYDGDPGAWAAYTLTDQLECVRQHIWGSGIGGQSVAVQTTNARITETVKAARIALEAFQEREETLRNAVATSLQQLDELAALWGDEGVFRAARDRLRKALEATKGDQE